MKKYSLLAWVVFLFLRGTPADCETIRHLSTERINQITLEQFLNSVGNDYRLKNIEELDQYIRNTPHSTPYLDEVELRTETDRFKSERQKYAFRIYPKGWGETACSDRLRQIDKEGRQIAYEADFQEVLKERYFVTIDYLETISLLELFQALDVNYEDQVRVLKSVSQGDLDFDINVLIKAQDDQVDLRLDIVKLENKLMGINHRIAVLMNREDAEFQLTSPDLMTVSHIKTHMMELPEKFSAENYVLRDYAHKKLKAEQQYALELAKNRDYLSYFQIAYDMEDSDDAAKAISIEFGFKLPFIHMDQDDIYRRKVEWVKEKLKYKEAELALMEKRISTKRILERYIDQHEILVKRKTEGDAASSFDVYRRMDGCNPLELLKINASMLKNDIRIAKTRFEILRQYIDLIDINGLLGERPLLNYLSEHGRLIQ